MTDLEIARLLARGRRQGFDQACGVAFAAFLALCPVLFFTNDGLRVATWLSTGVLGAMAIASSLTNQDPDGFSHDTRRSWTYRLGRVLTRWFSRA